jgi:hypothetical protein
MLLLLFRFYIYIYIYISVSVSVSQQYLIYRFYVGMDLFRPATGLRDIFIQLWLS